MGWKEAERGIACLDLLSRVLLNLQVNVIDADIF